MLFNAAVPFTSRPAVRQAVLLGYDAVATLCGLYAAMELRFSGQVPDEVAAAVRVAAPLLVLVRLLFVIGGGLHRWSFRMSGLVEAARLALAMLLASVVFSVAFYYVEPSGLPRTVSVLEFFLTVSLMAGLRFAPRFLEARYAEWRKEGCAGTHRAIIVGAGETGDLLARDLLRSRESKYFPVGFVDDDPAKWGMHVSGKPVLGGVNDLPRLIERLRISTVLLAIPRLPAEGIRRILVLCASSKATFKTIPASYAYLDKRFSAAMLHDLAPDDLLPRRPVTFDDGEIGRMVRGRRVLVTGAGGTIGGEICRQLASHGAAELVLVDMNENELYLRARGLHEQFPLVSLHAEVADIREPTRLQRLAEHYRPQDVFHAAAHKHVPLMEDAPEEAVKNNVFGTLHVAEMADRAGVERLVVISTDKAVNPSSVMGATKRIAELVVRDLARRSRTRMTAVRFGNVLGSAGSVVPLFKQQIEHGGPVTVTHPDCTRYFMTVSEAVGLVLLAGLGGYGDLCVLDMGKPIRIAEIAANLITMAGLIPEEEIAIVYTGLRPGEKLHEELLTDDEELNVQIRNRISVARSPPPPADLDRWLARLRVLAEGGDRERLLGAIHKLVPTYQRTEGLHLEALVLPAPVPVPAEADVAPLPSSVLDRLRRLPGLVLVNGRSGS